MLPYLVTSLPHHTLLYSNIVPLPSDIEIPVYSHGKVVLVDIINYFILTRQLDLAKRVYLSTDLSINYIECSVEDMAYLLSGVSCDIWQASCIMVDLYRIYDTSHQLNDIHKYLYSVTQDPRITGYCHITGYIPQRDEYIDYFNINNYLRNYAEVEYILGIMDPQYRKPLCKSFVLNSRIATDTVDPRCIKLILEYAECVGDSDYYVLYYTIAYGKLPEDMEIPKTFIGNCLRVLYDCKPFTIDPKKSDLMYVNMFEPILTDENKITRMKVYLSMYNCSYRYVPQKLQPRMHKIIAELVITGKWEYSEFIPDDCEWCQKLRRI